MSLQNSEQSRLKTITEISDFSSFFCDSYDPKMPHILIKIQISPASEVIRLNDIEGLLAESRMIKVIEEIISRNFADSQLVKISFNAFILVLEGHYEQHEQRLHNFINQNSPCEIEINNNIYYPRLLMGITPLGPHCGMSFSRLEFAMQKAFNSAGLAYWYVSENSRQFAAYCQNRLGLRIARRAIDSGELGLSAQPITPLEKNITGVKYEISLRHYLGPSDISSPDKILQYAEFNRISQDIDLYVISLLCKNYQKIFTDSNGNIDHLSVNLSGSSFTSPRFFGLFNDIVTAHNLPKEKIILEITETVAHHNVAQAINTMEKFKAAGFMLALDDIGIGSSNFHNLRLFPVDYFKIDRLYCEEIKQNQDTRRFIQLIIDIGKSQGKRIIAEGAPDKETLEILAAMGVDYSQSYLTGKPFELVKAPKFDATGTEL